MSEDKKEGFVVRDRRFWAEPESPTEQPVATEVTAPPIPSSEIERLRDAMAELEDAKLRVRRDAEKQVERLRANALESLIPVLDNLERCISAAETSRNVEGLLAGVTMVQGQFLRVLEEFGLERVSAVGERFDPHIHDAVAVIPVDDATKDGVVVGEVEAAYRFGDRIIRPAKVSVGRAASRQDA